MGNAALSPAPAEAATAAWRAPPAKDKGPRRPPRAPRPSEPKAVREAIPLPADVLPHLFSYSCAREVGTFRFLVSRSSTSTPHIDQYGSVYESAYGSVHSYTGRPPPYPA